MEEVIGRMWWSKINLAKMEMSVRNVIFVGFLIGMS